MAPRPGSPGTASPASPRDPPDSATDPDPRFLSRVSFPHLFRRRDGRDTTGLHSAFLGGRFRPAHPTHHHVPRDGPSPSFSPIFGRGSRGRVGGGAPERKKGRAPARRRRGDVESRQPRSGLDARLRRLRLFFPRCFRGAPSRRVVEGVREARRVHMHVFHTGVALGSQAPDEARGMGRGGQHGGCFMT